MKKKMILSATQHYVWDALKQGAIINYFRGIGTKYTPSADLEYPDKYFSPIRTTTLKVLRDKYNLLEEFERESYHSKYRLKTQN